MKLAIIGRTQMLYRTAGLFLAQGHEIVLVATCKEAPEYTVGASDFARLAEDCGALFLQGPNLAAHSQAMQDTGADIAVSMNWPGILTPEVLGLFPFGILNAHPGDLPRYRGNACPNWAILNGEKEVVLTIHQMAPELDAGDVILKEAFPLSDTTTIGEVYQWMESILPQLYVDAATGLVGGALRPQAQSTNPQDALRVYPRLPQDSYIYWNESAVFISRLVRASSAPFSGAYTYLNGEKLTILSARPGQYATPSLVSPGQVVGIDRSTGFVDVAAGNGFVTLERVLYNGKETSRPSEVISSLRTRLGLHIADELAALRKEVAQLRELVQNKE